MCQILFLLIVFLLASCASKEPVSFLPPPQKFPPGYQGEALFELRSPWVRQKGSFYFLLNAQAVYFESLSPFGGVLLQGLLQGEALAVVLTPQQRAYLLRLEHAPPALKEHWGELLLGSIPASWQVERAFRLKDQSLEVWFSLGEGFEARAALAPDYSPKQIQVFHEERLFSLRYHREGGVLLSTVLALAPLSGEVELSFLELKPLSNPKLPKVVIPPHFETKVYKVEL